MPFFIYNGLTNERKQRLLDLGMQYLESDFEPHPRFGGFPEPGGGKPYIYYPTSKDSPKALEDKRKRREAFRVARKKELIAGIEVQDKSITLWGVEFPKGERVELRANHPLLVPVNNGYLKRPPKMDALVEGGDFECVEDRKELSKSEKKDK
jgi:hypothetical protein